VPIAAQRASDGTFNRNALQAIAGAVLGALFVTILSNGMSLTRIDG